MSVVISDGLNCDSIEHDCTREDSWLLQASMGTIHVNFGAFKDVRSQVLANRGHRVQVQIAFFFDV